MEEKYDTALLGILQHEGKIERFLDVIFGFLFRRTDFYRIMKSKEDRLGFPPGVASKMISSIYKRYESIAASVEEEKEKQREQRERKKKEQSTAEPSKADSDVKEPEVPQVVAKTVEVNTDKPGPSKTKTDSVTVKTDSVDTDKTSAVSDRSKTDNIDKESQEYPRNGAESGDKMAKGDAKNAGKTEGERKNEKKGAKKKESKTGEEDEDPELIRQQKVFQSDPESYNGARRENYRWAQSITDLDFRINVPSHIKKGRDARVETGGKHAKVEYKDTAGTWLVAVDGDLTWEVLKDETVWSLVPGDHIHEAVENLNFVLGQSLVHNKKPRSSQMCAFNFKSVVKTKYENLLSLTYKTVIQLPEVEVDMQKPVSKRCCKECRSFYISEPGHEKMGSYCMKHSLPICTVWKCLSSLLHK